MNKIIPFLLFIFISILTYAQEGYNSKNLVVSKADLENRSYENDTTANAFFIYEKGHSYVQNGGRYNLLTDYEAKVKILNKEGYNQATIEVFLYRNKRGKELFKKLKAFTHNLENGKIIKTELTKNHVYREEINENYTSVKFTFPNLKEGSVITYKYQTESPFLYKFNGWEFQDDIPKMYSEFNADLPANYLYNIRLVGTLKLDIEENSVKKNCLEITGYGSADCSKSIYAMQDIPAFIEEEYMTTKRNYLSRIEYELKEYKGFDGTKTKYTKTWESVDDQLKKEQTLGIQLKKTNVVKDLLPQNIVSLPNNKEKAKAIYSFITKNYKWNSKYQIFRLNDASQIKKVLDTKTGNVSGINILLHNTLKQQGFDVYPVLLSTRKNGYATTLHPVILDFNYLIVQLKLNDKKYLLDATESQLAFGEIPFRCLNRYGRLLDFKNGSSWIDIKPMKRSSFYFKEKLVLNEQNQISAEGSYLYTGYYGLGKRKQLDQRNKEAYYEQVKKQQSDLTISEISIKNDQDADKPFEEHITFSYGTEELEDLIYIKPFIRAFFEENPFKLEKRTYPVDFGHKDAYTYSISLEIPSGYDFVDIPENKRYSLQNKLGTVSISTTRNGNKLVLSHRISFNSAYYPTEYYDALKEFFDLVIQIENDTFITVKKIS